MNDTARAEAIAWLVGRLRYEQLLTDLQRRADGTDHDAVASEPLRRAA